MNNKAEGLWKKIEANKTPGTMPISGNFWSKFIPGSLILEVGCGWGRIVYECLERGLNVIGIDINANEITALKNKLKVDHVKVTQANIIEKNILETGFNGNHFDGIIMQGVLSALNIADRRTCLKEALRIIKPGGYMHIGEFELNESNQTFKKRYDEDFLTTKEYGTLSVKDESGKEIYQSHNFSVDEITELLDKEGFINIQITKDIFTSYHGNKKPGMMILAQK